MMQLIKKYITIFACVAFAVITLAGPILITHFTADHGCPFMPAHHQICPMTGLSYAETFQRLISSSLPYFFLFLILISFVKIKDAYKIIAANIRSPAWHQIRQEPRHSFFTELFSQGILHARIP